MTIARSMFALALVATSAVLAGCNEENTTSADFSSYASAEANFATEYSALETDCGILISEYQDGKYDASLVTYMQRQVNALRTTAKQITVPGPFQAAHKTLLRSIGDFENGLQYFKKGASEKHQSEASIQEIDQGAKLFSNSSKEFTDYLNSYTSTLKSASSAM